MTEVGTERRSPPALGLPASPPRRVRRRPLHQPIFSSTRTVRSASATWAHVRISFWSNQSSTSSGEGLGGSEQESEVDGLDRPGTSRGVGRAPRDLYRGGPLLRDEPDLRERSPCGVALHRGAEVRLGGLEVAAVLEAPGETLVAERLVVNEAFATRAGDRCARRARSRRDAARCARSPPRRGRACARTWRATVGPSPRAGGGARAAPRGARPARRATRRGGATRA